MDAKAACSSKLYGMQDQLRQEHEALFQAQQQHINLQKDIQKLEKELKDSQVGNSFPSYDKDRFHEQQQQRTSWQAAGQAG